MTKINREEYEILMGLIDSWKWIARDNDTALWVYEKEPRKHDDYWNELSEGREIVGSDSFQFIQWEDENPFSIAELIEEYEKEREETEVKKDIEWAKNKIDLEVIRRIGREEPHFYVNVGLKMALDFLNQLDEPVELQELIEKYSKDSMSTYDVKVEREKFVNDLQNLLVPEQELPEIPQFVSGWIEETKKQGKSYIYAIAQIYDKYETGEPLSEEENRIFQWGEAYDNDEVFARAWLDGYTVEEEPLYRARLKVITNQFIASYLRTQSSEAEDRLKTLEIGSKYIHEDYRGLSEFTEDELKRIDIWDSDQWEIEEVEENAKN